MSRNLDPKGKIVRRFGQNIFENPKFDRLLDKKPAPPGAPKRRRPRISEFGKQLGEKQKLRFAYGMNERQFRNTFKKAKQLPGVTGDNMITLLESRLDNVIFRLGMAATRAQARQVVSHGHIRVNDKKVNIPSALVSAGDVITIREKDNSKKFIQEFIAENAGKELPEWLEFSKVDGKGTVVRLPQSEDVQPVGDVQLVVEFYSK